MRFSKKQQRRSERTRRRSRFENLECRRLLAADIVRDITSDNVAAAPTEVVAVGNLAFFANDDIAGNELWVSDGTVAGTSRVADIVPGQYSSSPTRLTPFNGGVVFQAREQAMPYPSIWYSDGTAAGTIKLADDLYIYSAAEVGGELIIAAYRYDGSYQPEIWKTDGTALGTVAVDTTTATNVDHLTVVNDKLFFIASDANGRELWVTEGVSGTTELVKDILQGAYGSNPEQLVAANGLLFFTADDGANGRELWISDGTSAGTVMVADVNPEVYTNGAYSYPRSSYIAELTAAGPLVFFTADDGLGEGRRLWAADGTVGGFAQVGTINSPQQLVTVDEDVFLSGYSPYSGGSLWKTEGSALGTVIVTDIDPRPPYSPSPSELTEFDGKLYFRASDSDAGDELWTSNGTAAGTQRLSDLRPGVYGSNPRNFFEAGGRLFFGTETILENGRSELWMTDGTAAGTVEVAGNPPIGYWNYFGTPPTGTVGTNSHLIFPSYLTPDLYSVPTTSPVAAPITSNFRSGDTNPRSLTEINGELYFQAMNHLWKSDGTASGTIILDPPAQLAIGGLFPASDVVEIGDAAFFVAYDDVSGYELWKSDGTVAGTLRVTDINPGTGSSDINELTAVGTTLFFAANDGTSGQELWKYDTITETTSLVRNIRTTANEGSYPSQFTNVDGILFFTADNGVSGRELWSSGGTSATTAIVANLTAGAGSSNISGMVAFNGQLIFKRDSQLRSATTTSTTLLGDFNSGFGFFFAPDDYAEFDGELYFTADYDEIWKTDGTAAGTVLAADLTAGYGYAYPYQLTAAAGRLFFAASNVGNSSQQELWSFDGTTAALVKDIQVGPIGSNPIALTSFHDKLLFFANDGIHGTEPWVSDGSEAGTNLLNDIHVATSTSSIQTNLFGQVAVADEQLFFVANDGIQGLELWRITFPLVSADEAIISGQEGSEFTTTGTLRFTDSIVADFGNVTDNLDGTWTWTGTPTDGPEVTTVTITVTDSSGLTATASFDLDVANVPPTTVLSGNATTVEGANYSLDLGEIVDPGDDTVTEWIVDWGDGSSDTYSAAGIVTHTYLDGNASVLITVSVTDEDGTYVADTRSVNVLNVAPTTTLIGNSSVNEGAVYSLDLGTLVDPGQDTVTNWLVDWGDGTTDNYGSSGVVTHTFSDGNASYLVTVSVTDEDGNFVADSLAVDVVNVAPAATLSGDASVNEGDLYELTLGSVTDPGTDTVIEYIVDWGDGSSDTYSAAGVVTHTYADGDASYVISLAVSDEDGTFDVDTLAIDVLNVAPTATLSGNATVNEGDSYQLTLSSVTDPGTDTVTQWIVDWGEGSLDTYTAAGLVTHTYADGNASYVISLAVSDEDGTFDVDTLAVDVLNVAPTATLTGNSSVNEGDLYELTLGSVTDPGTDTVTQWIVDWGDGSTDTYTGAGLVTHTYADDDASYVISLAVIDEDGTFDVDTLAVDVLNVAPTATLSGNETVNEGDSYQLTLSSVTDPGADTVTQWIVDWGDGSTDTYTAAGLVTHTYADGNASYVISLAVSDEDGTFDVDTLAIDVLNVAPTATLTGNSSVNEGDVYELTLGSVTDPGTDTVIEYIVDWGDGSSDTYTAAGVVTHTYADGNATHVVSLSIKDEDGTFVADTLTVNVLNVVPTATISGEAIVAEGSVYELTLGTIVDPGQETAEYIVDWGDGSSDTYSTAGVVTHVYADGDASPVISVNISDEDGNHFAGSIALEVENVAPSFDLGPDETTSLLSRTINFDDPGADTWAGSVNFGDGSASQSLVIDPLSKSFVIQHFYATAGDFTVTVNLSDDDGGSATDTFVVTVEPVSGVIELDNLSSEFAIEEGTWGTSSFKSGFVGADYRFASGGDDTARFTPVITSAGTYEVLANWTDGVNRATNARIEIVHDGGVTVMTVDQTKNGGTFQSLGTFTFAAGQSGSIALRTLGTDGFVVADAIRLVPVTANVIQLDNSDPSFAIENGNWGTSTARSGFLGSDYRFASGGNRTARFTPIITASGTYEVFANWTDGTNRATNARFEIVHDGGTTVVSVDQTKNGGAFQSLGKFPFVAGQLSSVAVRTLGTDGIVVADAIRLVPVTTPLIPLDDSDPAFTIESGSWGTSASRPGFVGTQYRFASGGDQTARFTPTIPTAGMYEVFANWTDGTNRATNARFEIVHDGGTTVVTVDQTENGGAFHSLGAFPFLAGQSGSIAIRTLGTDGIVVADAIRLTPLNTAAIQIDNSDPTFAVESGPWGTTSAKAGFVGTDYRFASGGDKTVRFTPTIVSGGTYEVLANWTSGLNRATNARFEIVHDGGTTIVTVDQTNSGGAFQSLGTFGFIAGQSGSIAVRTLGTDGLVIADAIRLVPTAPVAVAFRSAVALASSTSVAPATFENADVSRDNSVTSLDALMVINFLNSVTPSGASGEYSSFDENDRVEQLESAARFDVNQDGKVTALDALTIINDINVQSVMIANESLAIQLSEPTSDKEDRVADDSAPQNVFVNETQVDSTSATSWAQSVDSFFSDAGDDSTVSEESKPESGDSLKLLSQR